MRWIGIFALAVLLVLAACAPQGPTCTEPYVIHGAGCCLDKNSDGVCDSDARERNDSLAVSCELCPPKFITQKEEVVVYRYVCMNGTIVEDTDECAAKIVSNAEQFELNTNQDPEYISEFSARPACRGRYPAAELHIALTRPATAVAFMMKSDPAGSYKPLGSLNASLDILDDDYFYVGFCSPEECGTITNSQLTSGTAYAIRGEISFENKTVQTREVLVDPTPSGEYGKKEC